MDSPSVFVLPDEIWFQIFAHYLPLDDRKNIRLTCRHFYDVCNDTRIQGKEEFVFQGDLIAVAAILSLSNCSRKVWNIKLSYVNDVRTTLAFFNKQGTFVRSLVFEECEFNHGVLKSLIEECINLCSTSLIFSLEQWFENRAFK